MLECCASNTPAPQLVQALNLHTQESSKSGHAFNAISWWAVVKGKTEKRTQRDKAKSARASRVRFDGDDRFLDFAELTEEVAQRVCDRKEMRVAQNQIKHPTSTVAQSESKQKKKKKNTTM
jgi:hypothetical protein